MKLLRTLCSHGGLILPLMVAVFLCIHTVNPAMAFYDHLYTKLLLCAIGILTLATLLLLCQRKRLFLPLAFVFLALALWEITLCLFSLFFEPFPLFTDLAGQASAWALCLSSLVLSLLLRFSSEKTG